MKEEKKEKKENGITWSKPSLVWFGFGLVWVMTISEYMNRTMIMDYKNLGMNT